jgi:hypothetical protein
MSVHFQSKRKTAAQVAQGIRDGKFTALETVETSLSNAKFCDESRKLNIFLKRADEYAMSRAARVDSDNAKSSMPLAGVPYAAKDNIAVAGLQVTCGSRILEGYISPYTATAVDRLEKAGAVMMGKANSRWARRWKTARLAQQRIRWRPSSFRVVHRAVQRPLSQQAFATSRSAPRPVARSGSPPRSAASSA